MLALHLITENLALDWLSGGHPGLSPCLKRDQNTLLCAAILSTYLKEIAPPFGCLPILTVKMSSRHFPQVLNWFITQPPLCTEHKPSSLPSQIVFLKEPLPTYAALRSYKVSYHVCPNKSTALQSCTFLILTLCFPCSSVCVQALEMDHITVFTQKEV